MKKLVVSFQWRTVGNVKEKYNPKLVVGVIGDSTAVIRLQKEKDGRWSVAIRQADWRKDGCFTFKYLKEAKEHGLDFIRG